MKSAATLCDWKKGLVYVRNNPICTGWDLADELELSIGSAWRLLAEIKEELGITPNKRTRDLKMEAKRGLLRSMRAENKKAA